MIVRIASILLACATCSACAVNDLGLVRVERFEYGNAYLVRLHVIGLHLLTNDADASLTIGQSNRTYIYPKPTAGPGVLPPQRELESRLATRADGEFPGLAQLGRPMALITEATGLVVNANTLRVGVVLGREQRAVIQIPPDFQGVFRIQYDSEKAKLLPNVFTQGVAP